MRVPLRSHSRRPRQPAGCRLGPGRSTGPIAYLSGDVRGYRMTNDGKPKWHP